jgi:hypothetical protein
MSVPATLDIPASELNLFLRRLKGGGGEQLAAAAVGWSPLRLKQVLSQPEIQDAIKEVRRKDIETLERKAYRLAERGNTEMLKLWLFCQAGDRGWRPPTQRVETVRVGMADPTVIASVRQAISEALTRGELQPAACDDDIVDAEIVEDIA